MPLRNADRVHGQMRRSNTEAKMMHLRIEELIEYTEWELREMGSSFCMPAAMKSWR
jgi:hypothetical protein